MRRPQDDFADTSPSFATEPEGDHTTSIPRPTRSEETASGPRRGLQKEGYAGKRISMGDSNDSGGLHGVDNVMLLGRRRTESI
jgi:hypothetical protein